jgi:hypothetical protein
MNYLSPFVPASTIVLEAGPPTNDGHVAFIYTARPQLFAVGSEADVTAIIHRVTGLIG